MRILGATVAAALWAALCMGTGAPTVALRIAKRLQRCNAHVIITRHGARRGERLQQILRVLRALRG
jgi:hypothetical protein